MKYVTFLLLFASAAFAQQKFTVRDSLTQKPVAYATVNLLNDYGLYANADGEVTIEDKAITAIEVSSIGYGAKKIVLATVTDDVYLSPRSIELDEVVVAVKKPKRIEGVVKPKGHQNEAKMSVSYIGMMYAFLVKPDKANSYLTKIVMPLMEKDFVWDVGKKQDPFKKTAYKALIKVEVLVNNNDTPGDKLNDYKQIVLIDNAKDATEFTFNLSDEVAVPKDGLFVKLTILGNADQSGNLIAETPYDLSIDKDGKQRKWSKQMQPHFPLFEAPKGLATYVADVFGMNTQWKTIKHALIYDPDKTYNGFNIGFGYTTVVYE